VTSERPTAAEGITEVVDNVTTGDTPATVDLITEFSTGKFGDYNNTVNFSTTTASVMSRMTSTGVTPGNSRQLSVSIE